MLIAIGEDISGFGRQIISLIFCYNDLLPL